MSEQIIETKWCSRAKHDMPLDSFAPNKKTKDGLWYWCISCVNTANRESYHRHREKNLAYQKRYRTTNREKVKASIRRCMDKKRDAGFYRTQKWRDGQKAYLKQLRETAISRYGGPVCACCGENTSILMMTLDHIDGKGAAHRKMLKDAARGVSGPSITLWLRQNGYPEGFQVLCNSCNLAKHLSGVNKCPHEIEREALWQSFLKHAAIPMAA